MAGLLDWWNGEEVSPITGGPLYVPPGAQNASPTYAPPARTGREAVERVRDEYLHPEMRGVGVNTVLGFAEGPATVGGKFPMTPGRQAVRQGDASVEYRVTPHAGVLVDRLETAPEARGKGQARSLMQGLLGDIDAARLRSELIPEADEGVSQKRLEKFYRSLGYRATGQGNMVRKPPPAAADVPLPVPPVVGNLDYGAEVLRQRAAQLDLPRPQRIQPDPAAPAFDARPTPEMLPGVEQQVRPWARTAPGEALPLGDRARPLVAHKGEIADKMAAGLEPLLGHDTQYFYHLKPVYDALRKDGMRHEDALAFIQRDFAPTNAGTSPRTNTEQNLLNMSLLQWRRAQGMPTSGAAMQAEGNAKGYPMIYGTHPPLVEGMLNNTHDFGRNPKPDAFRENIGGNLAPTTVDTHAIRGAVGTLNDLRPGLLGPEMLTPEARAGYAADPTKLNWATDIADSLASKTVKGKAFQPEYPVFHDIYEAVGERLGIPAADAQSLGWFANGPKTGLMSAARSIPQLLNERLSVTAQALGISPEKALSLYRRGQIPLMGGAGAAVAPGLLEEEPAGVR